jgi:single-strand DNA-binding protein
MNIFTFTGNLGKDCRLGNVSGTAVCNFSVAAKSGYGDKEQTLWVDCALWGKQAESTLPTYLVKGQQVAVSGELSRTDDNGTTYLKLRVNNITLVGGKPAQPTGQQAPTQPAPTQPTAKPVDDFDDCIPF